MDRQHPTNMLTCSTTVSRTLMGVMLIPNTKGAKPTVRQLSKIVRDSSCVASESQHERRHSVLLSG